MQESKELMISFKLNIAKDLIIKNLGEENKNRYIEVGLFYNQFIFKYKYTITFLGEDHEKAVWKFLIDTQSCIYEQMRKAFLFLNHNILAQVNFLLWFLILIVNKYFLYLLYKTNNFY